MQAAKQRAQRVAQTSPISSSPRDRAASRKSSKLSVAHFRIYSKMRARFSMQVLEARRRVRAVARLTSTVCRLTEALAFTKFVYRRCATILSSHEEDCSLQISPSTIRFSKFFSRLRAAPDFSSTASATTPSSAHDASARKSNASALRTRFCFQASLRHSTMPSCVR